MVNTGAPDDCAANLMTFPAAVETILLKVVAPFIIETKVDEAKVTVPELALNVPLFVQLPPTVILGGATKVPAVISILLFTIIVPAEEKVLPDLFSFKL
jgi:ABC-type proline/glycine betaine transport system permease subunit